MKTPETTKAVVFGKVLQSMNFTGIRMIFPYVDVQGNYKYAALEAEDLYKNMKWDVNSQGIKEPMKKTVKKVTKKK